MKVEIQDNNKNVEFKSLEHYSLFVFQGVLFIKLNDISRHNSWSYTHNCLQSIDSCSFCKQVKNIKVEI